MLLLRLVHAEALGRDPGQAVNMHASAAACREAVAPAAGRPEAAKAVAVDEALEEAPSLGGPAAAASSGLQKQQLLCPPPAATTASAATAHEGQSKAIPAAVFLQTPAAAQEAAARASLATAVTSTINHLTFELPGASALSTIPSLLSILPNLLTALYSPCYPRNRSSLTAPIDLAPMETP